MRMVVLFSRYFSGPVAEFKDLGNGQFIARACAGARRTIIELRANGLEMPVRAADIARDARHRALGLPAEEHQPAPGGIAFRPTRQGRQVLFEVKATAEETGRLAVVGLYADHERVGPPGIAVVREGMLALDEHPALKDFAITSSGAGCGMIFVASLSPADPPLALPIGGIVYLIHPDGRIEDPTKAELVAELGNEEFIPL